MRTRTLLWLAPLLPLIGAAGPVAAADRRTVPLFVIERSKNANVVHYDARLDAAGRLDPKEPVAAYWIMKAEDGRREDLNWLERSKAYGFETKPDGADCYRMTLAAYAEREVKVCRDDAQGARAVLTIGGRPALFDKLYINATEGFIKPTVNYLELFGRDVESGEPRHEKILPK